MANKDRQKRSARKARAAERQELEEKRAAATPVETKKKPGILSKADKKEPVKKETKKSSNGFFGRIRTWFGDVRSEMHRVTWPSKTELKNYSVAVIVMLIVFGVAIWLIDTGVVALLVGYSGLRG